MPNIDLNDWKNGFWGADTQHTLATDLFACRRFLRHNLPKLKWPEQPDFWVTGVGIDAEQLCRSVRASDFSDTLDAIAYQIAAKDVHCGTAATTIIDNHRYRVRLLFVRKQFCISYDVPGFSHGYDLVYNIADDAVLYTSSENLDCYNYWIRNYVDPMYEKPHESTDDAPTPRLRKLIRT